MGVFAQFREFGPYFHNGKLVQNPRVYHYFADMTVERLAWTDRVKGSTAPQPIVGNAAGIASGYFDGLYKFEVRLSDDVTVIHSWDHVDLSDGVHSLSGVSVQNAITVNSGSFFHSPAIPLPGVLLGDYVFVAAPVSLQGLLASAYASSADTVKFTLLNQTGGNVTLAAGTWTFRVLQNT